MKWAYNSVSCLLRYIQNIQFLEVTFEIVQQFKCSRVNFHHCYSPAVSTHSLSKSQSPLKHTEANWSKVEKIAKWKVWTKKKRISTCKKWKKNWTKVRKKLITTVTHTHRFNFLISNGFVRLFVRVCFIASYICFKALRFKQSYVAGVVENS